MHAACSPDLANTGAIAIHALVASTRADALHKATSSLAARYETVVAEDLNLTGMLANREAGPRRG